MIDTLFEFKVSSNWVFWGSIAEHRLVGRCRLQIYGSLVIATELPDNPGMSITNAAEEIATQVCETYEIYPQFLTWIEHYLHEDSRLEETYDLVRFTWDQDHFIKPCWQRMTHEQVQLSIEDARVGVLLPDLKDLFMKLKDNPPDSEDFFSV